MKKKLLEGNNETLQAYILMDIIQAPSTPSVFLRNFQVSLVLHTPLYSFKITYDLAGDRDRGDDRAGYLWRVPSKRGESDVLGLRGVRKREGETETDC